MLDFASLPREFLLRLVLVRHGEPEHQAIGKCYGSLDVSLSPAGRTQIHAKFAAIRNLTVGALCASPLKRAIESAEIAAGFVALPVTICDELREINFGSFEGLTYEEVERRYPEEYRTWMARPTEIHFPHGESFADVKSRVLRFKDRLLSQYPGKTVLLVSHGGANRILLAQALGMPDHAIFRIDQSHAAVNVIDYVADSQIVRLVNG